MPRTKKPAGAAVDRRNGRRAELAVAPSSGVEQFPAPERVCEAARSAWSDFWADRPALLLTPSSRVVLLRWVDALDRYLRTTAEADLQPLVEGSTGQLVENPLYRIAEKARATMETCERQLGIGGMNAANLGLAAVSEAKSLADMNARYGGGGGDEEQGPPVDEPDPRISVVRGELA